METQPRTSKTTNLNRQIEGSCMVEQGLNKNMKPNIPLTPFDPPAPSRTQLHSHRSGQLVEGDVQPLQVQQWVGQAEPQPGETENQVWPRQEYGIDASTNACHGHSHVFDVCRAHGSLHRRGWNPDAGCLASCGFESR